MTKYDLIRNVAFKTGETQTKVEKNLQRNF